jgi:hypothetical protein
MNPLLERRGWYTLDVSMKDGSLVLTVRGNDAVRAVAADLLRWVFVGALA